MSETPSEQVLRWAAAAVGKGAQVVAVQSLHGGWGPWLLRVEHEGSTHEVVLRVAGRIFPFQIATGAAALRVAAAHGLAAPRLLASDLDGRATGAPATLETVVPGSSASPATVSAARLRAAGAAIARVHKIRLDPQPDLPLKHHSLQGPTLAYERPLERHWAALYRASSDSERPAVVAALAELTGWGAERARQVMAGTHATPLLQLADDLLGAIPTPREEPVFLHADLWAGNMVWSGETTVTLIDWKDAGVGDPGVDVGHLRMQMAVQYGPDAAERVREGWERERGRAATNLAYWDAVAALHTPADLDDGEPALTARRDAFLRAALDRLGRK